MKTFSGFLVGLVGSPVSLTTRLFKGEWPQWPSTEKLTPSKPGDFWHYSKNVVTEIVRADPQFWGQALGAAFILALIF